MTREEEGERRAEGEEGRGREGRTTKDIRYLQERWTAREMGRTRKPIYMHIYKCLPGHAARRAAAGHGYSAAAKKVNNQCAFPEQIKAGGHVASGDADGGDESQRSQCLHVF